MHFSPLLISTVVALVPFSAIAAPISSSGATNLGISKRDVASQVVPVLGTIAAALRGEGGDANALAGTAGNTANILAGTTTGAGTAILKNAGNNGEDTVTESEGALIDKRDVASEVVPVLGTIAAALRGEGGDANALAGTAGNTANILAGTTTGAGTTILKNAGNNGEDTVTKSEGTLVG